jgi:hypothetical protein
MTVRVIRQAAMPAALQGPDRFAEPPTPGKKRGGGFPKEARRLPKG